MTSNNKQEFVKAFSRRSRAVVTKPSPEGQSVAPVQPSSPAPKAVDTGVVPQVGAVPQVDTVPQITRVDPPQSVTGAAQTSRAERQRVAHQVGEQQRATSLQHIHTAYSAPPPAPPVEPSLPEPLDPLHGAATERIDSQARGPVGPHYPSTNTGPAANTGPNANTGEPHAQNAEADSSPDRRVEPFQAVWEVDVFDVPGSVADLFFDGRRHQQIAERMGAAVKSGLQSVLVTSNQSGEGRSSVAIGFAMAAAASGIRVALVDADTNSPTLADDLRLDLKYGWIDTVRGGLPIKEAAVYAVEDGVTLIPLMPPHGQTAATAYEVTRLIETLKNHFDLLIVDGPSAESRDLNQIATMFDSAVIVRDARRTKDQAVQQTATRMQAVGVQGVGVVDNFV